MAMGHWSETVLPDVSSYNMPKWEKYTKRTQNIPFGHYINIPNGHYINIPNGHYINIPIGRKTVQRAIEEYINHRRIHQHFPFQYPPKFTLNWDFGFENKPSGIPGSENTQFRS
jgi:hypothetical protein